MTEDAVVKYLIENFPDLALLLLGGWLAWKVSRPLREIDRLSDWSKDMDDKRDEMNRWRGAVDADRQTFRELIADVRSTLKEILLRLPPSDPGSDTTSAK